MPKNKTFSKAVRTGNEFRTQNGEFLFAIDIEENSTVVVFPADTGLKNQNGDPLTGRERWNDCCLLGDTLLLLQRDGGFDEFQILEP
jgi:hypothetical protein